MEQGSSLKNPPPPPFELATSADLALDAGDDQAFVAPESMLHAAEHQERLRPVREPAENLRRFPRFVMGIEYIHPAARLAFKERGHRAQRLEIVLAARGLWMTHGEFMRHAQGMLAPSNAILEYRDKIETPAHDIGLPIGIVMDAIRRYTTYINREGMLRPDHPNRFEGMEPLNLVRAAAVDHSIVIPAAFSGDRPLLAIMQKLATSLMEDPVGSIVSKANAEKARLSATEGKSVASDSGGVMSRLRRMWRWR